MRVRFFLILSALLYAGCSGGTDGVSAEDRQTTLVRGNGAEVASLDPAIADDIHAFNVLIDAYEGLVAVDARGQIVSGVAKTWDVSDNGLVYTFNLREDARWSTGDKVLAADFVRGFRHVAESTTTSFYATLFDSIVNFHEVISGDKPASTIAVEALSDTKLKITLTKPTHHFLELLALPAALPRHQSDDYLVSNGAYRFNSVKTFGTIELVKNEHYWNSDSVFFNAVRYLPVVDETTELNMYRTGEIDITHSIPDQMVKSQRIENPSQVKIAPSLAFYYYAFDTTEPPFDNENLRRALSMAIDRDKIVELLGRGDAAAYGVVPPGVSNYSGSAYAWSSLNAADRLSMARGFFEDAGYTVDRPLEIELLYDAGGIHEKVALLVSAMWKEHLGVETQLIKREWQYFLQSREQRADWDVMRFSWFGDYNAASTFLEIFASDSLQNLPRYQNTLYDEQLLAASNSRDIEQASDHLKSAEKILIEDFPIIPLYFFVSKHMVDDSIEGFETNVVDRHPSQYLRRRSSAD
ncbi:MAG: peptide ABC transporter substrate-binding protein [Woeseiaceae bacterium]